MTETVRQHFTFEEAMGRYREIAELNVDLADIGRRLRLRLEPGHTAQLGPVEAAFFAIRDIGFVVYRYGEDQLLTVLGLFLEEETGAVAAVDVLLEALGIDWRAVDSIKVGADPDSPFGAPVLDEAFRPRFGDPDRAGGARGER